MPPPRVLTILAVLCVSVRTARAVGPLPPHEIEGALRPSHGLDHRSSPAASPAATSADESSNSEPSSVPSSVKVSQVIRRGVEWSNLEPSLPPPLHIMTETVGPPQPRQGPRSILRKGHVVAVAGGEIF